MSDTTGQLIAILADGRVHSGADVARKLGLSRAAIWKSIKSLQALGLSVESIKGRGYCLSSPLDLMSQGSIEQGLMPDVRSRIQSLNIVDSCLSTNALVSASGEPHGAVYFAEHQQAGRGRRGRHWVSPYAENIYCSLGWLCEGGVQLFSGFSLAVGVVVARWLSAQGVEGLSLKWPNDILLNNKKLGGILIEISGDLHGQCCLAVGVGLNVHMQFADDIDQPWTSLAMNGYVLKRGELAAGLLNQLVSLLANFSETGFAPYLEPWAEFDGYCGREVSVHSGANVLTGRCLGVNTEGALLVETTAGVEALAGGEVSLRLSS